MKLADLLQEVCSTAECAPEEIQGRVGHISELVRDRDAMPANDKALALEELDVSPPKSTTASMACCV